MEVGTHIQKSKAFYLTLTTFFDNVKNKNRPVQLFTGSPKFWRRPKLQKKDVEDTKKLVKFQNLSVYIHSIYLINLCRSPEEFSEKAFQCIKWEMQAGLLMGFKGVVIHCGKSIVTSLIHSRNPILRVGWSSKRNCIFLLRLCSFQLLQLFRQIKLT